MGVLTSFDALGKRLILGLPANYVSRSQNPDASVDASSTASGTTAEMMLDDGHQEAWVSGTLGGDIVLTFDFGKLVTIDLIALAANNLQPANGMRIEVFDDVGQSNIVVDSGILLDCVVRPDSDITSSHVEENIKANLNHSLFIFAPTPARGFRATIDTAAGNGSALSLDVAFAAAMKMFDVLDGVSQNATTAHPIGQATESVGGGGTADPKYPLREQVVPLSFLEQQELADLQAYLGTPKRSQKAFVFAHPHDLLSFPYSAFFAAPKAASGTSKISSSIGKSTVTFRERR